MAEGGITMDLQSRLVRIFFVLTFLLSMAAELQAQPAEDHRTATQLFDEGNYAEALEAYAKVIADPTADAEHLVASVDRAIQCYHHLNRLSETDAFLESTAKTHANNWRVLGAVAWQVANQQHYGTLIAGEFQRGPQRGGVGKVVNAIDRDRVRALKLFRQALTQLNARLVLLNTRNDEQKSPAAFALMQHFAGVVLRSGEQIQYWRLQELTDLDNLPGYEDGWDYGAGAPSGAPVNKAGEPVYYELPASWDAAKNDGERWRWLLAELVKWQPERRAFELIARAEFLQTQFGVQTLVEYSWWFGRQTATDENKETGTFALHTLKDNETIARLATGVKRFDLPDEQNYIKLYEQASAAVDGKAEEQFRAQWDQAFTALATEFENRRQYPRAAEYWSQLAQRTLNPQGARERFLQITGNWGRFEPVAAQPAGTGVTVDFRYRNGKRVSFVAKKIDVPKLLTDVKAYLKSNPDHLDWEQLQIENLGYRLVTKEQKYVGAEVAKWSVDLQPAANHIDRRMTVTTPLEQPGAYLLTATMEGGNSTNIVLWVNDTAIVKKPLAGEALYYVADAKSGKPVAGANVELFGYWQEHLDGNRYRVETKNFAEVTDANGMAKIIADETNRKFQWLGVVTDKTGRFAYLGFRQIWNGDYYDQEYRQVKVFSITDRPVYRPQQQLYFKFWVANAQFDAPEESAFAGKSFQVEIRDPKNERVYSTQVIADLYGGLAGTWTVPTGATLGQYQINVVNHGGGTFRVEEYKKPEFEVTVEAPQKPVTLGEKINAKIIAKYYFGSPVVNAKVHYKVLRTPYNEPWFPPGPWDWLYGRGYGWFGNDYSWYPGWARWGCIAPYPWWIWRAPTPPEIVADQIVEIGPDGTVNVEIDTAIAKELHPNQDQSYEVQAEVVDESRRTIVGSGKVLAAREPFRVVLWTDRGHYRVTDTVTVGAAAHTLDGKPVAGTGKLRLLKITYEDAKPVESEVGRWELNIGETGQAELPIKASDPGQYRLSYELTDSEGHTIEGGHVFTIAGDEFDGSQFQFNDLEIVTDRRTYEPGQKAVLRINTNQVGSAVLLFVRPANGIYHAPQLVQLAGKSTLVEVDVQVKDTPNFFVEAVTVHGGRMHTLVRELYVPPVQRVLNIDVVPSAKEYLPGEAAKVSLKVTDIAGKPFVGSLALAVYDKALDYIAGGSNVGDIREFFWKWRRSHQSQGETNLQVASYEVTEPNQPTMQNLGIFGETVIDEVKSETGKDWFQGQNAPRQRMMLGMEATAAPMAAAMADGAVGGAVDERNFDFAAKGADTGAAPAFVQPTIRQNFADTAFWQAALVTNAEGIAEVEFPMPENLTTWRIRAWGMGAGTRVGEGSAEVVSRKNLIVRLQSPRFFVERDEVVLSANVHNYLPTAKEVQVKLELEGNTIEAPANATQTVSIVANDEARVDWRVKMVREGQATIRMSALTDEESDAMQMSFPVLVHGMLKTESYTNVIRPADTKRDFKITIPNERRAEQTRLEIRYTPTLAGAMVDALPYLIDYPYGCTEQTLNRFLPSVITRQTLREMNLDLAAIKEKRTNLNSQDLNSQELGDDAQRAEGWQRFERNPVFDDTELDSMVKAGVNRLTEMQLADGGWGWFSGFGEQSSAHTTATVVHGLIIAEKTGVALVPGVLDRGLAWLENYQAEQVRRIENYAVEQAKPVAERTNTDIKPFADNIDALVFMVLSERPVTPDNQTAPPSTSLPKMRDFLYRDRTKLAVYSLATYGVALQIQGEAEKLAMVMRNISQFVREDDENQTAWLELPQNIWWFWYGSEFEAQAYYLKLLCATDPQNEVASRMVKYLLNNRKHASYWNSTRDTALVVEAFADFLNASGESKPNLTVEVWIDGQQRKQVSITPENLFTFDNKLVLTGDELSAGDHTIEVRKQGDGPVYFSGYLTNFTLEDNIAAAGLELKVDRQFYKLTPADKTKSVAGGQGQVVEQRVEKYDRTPITDVAELKSGDLVEVELTVDSKNDYEYIMLEDMKAAGFEPVEVRSGYNGNELGAYVEYRDERVCLFASRMPRGTHSISYRLRAEIPGKFSALPAKASAMYAPELKANSNEAKLQIVD
jgi:uncharacterized protein YfaS (alpha-2-macroglobulin family)